MQERQRWSSAVRSGPPAEFRRVSMRCLSHCSGQWQHLLQWLQAQGAQEMQWAQSLDKGPWLQMYTVPGNCMRLGWQTTEGSPGRTWQAGGGSFLLLPRRHTVSSRWLWTFNHNMWKPRGGSSSRLKDLQPVLSSCHLSFKTRGRVYSSCVWRTMLHASETWPLTKPNLRVCSEVTGQWSDRSAMSGRKTLSPPGPRSYLCGLALRSAPHSEGEKTGMVWTCRMLQWCSQNSLWHTGGLGGPRWHGSSWQRGIAESGSSGLSTLMIDIPGDLLWDLPCVQPASYLEGGPLMWMLPLYLHVNQKSDYDMIETSLCNLNVNECLLMYHR